MVRTADTELLAGKADIGTESKKPPYPPSWIDRVTDSVKQLPIPAWSFYSVLALALVLSDAAVNWSNGSYLASSSFPFHLMSDLTPAIIVAMIHYFDDFIGVAYGSIYLLFLYDWQINQFRIVTSPVASVFNVTLALLNYMAYSIIVYHTIHQMRMISRIYSKCKQIDLFQLSPLYAFSTLAARISIAIAVMTYAWIYAFSVSGDIVSTLTPLFAIPLLFATFILPLLGIHTLLQEEKRRLQSENALHLKAAIKELHRRREAGEYEKMDGVGKAIDSLVKEQTLLKEIPTWPWHPDTVRWVATALLAPVVFTLVTRFAQRLLGF